jgi:hypothetical protein
VGRDGKAGMRVMNVARWVIVGGLSWAVVGCSTPTKLEGVSSKAAAGGAGYRRPLVCGVGRSPEVRRRVEEAFKKELNDRGVDAVPSIDYVPETQQANEQMLATVVRNSKADAILLTRLAKVERRADVDATVAPRATVPPGGAKGYYGIYAWAWGGVYDPPQVYAVDSVVLETFLIDTRTSAVVWSGATRVMDPTRVKQDAAVMAKHVVGDLVKREWVSGAPR